MRSESDPDVLTELRPRVFADEDDDEPKALSPNSIYRTASFHDRILSQEMRRRRLDEIQEAREKAEQEKEEQEAQKGDKYSVEAAKKKAEAMAKAQFHAERRGAPRIVSSSSLAVVSLS